MAEKKIDQITQIYKDADRIRNIAIAAHIDHGKTTFSDNLLAGAGMMSEELAGKATALDFHEDEQSRGITIDSASTSMVQTFKDQKYLINLIDTPGHVDFGGDVTRAMRAVDGAIVLTCAVEGIMPQTETVLRQALKERVKPILFINKVDRMIKELQLSPEKMQERFVTIINEVNKLIVKIAEKEFGEKWQANVQEGSVCFGSAYHNWALSIPYMKENGITFKDIIDSYEAGAEEYKALRKKAPLHEVILNAVIRHLPAPKQAQEYRVPRLWHGDHESTEGTSLINCDPKGPMIFVPIKLVIDPQAGEIATGRLFSGTIKRGLEVNVSGLKEKQRIQQVFIMNGAKREIVEEVPAGNIIGVGGLKTQAGDTVSEGEIEPFEKLKHIFDPVITKAIEAEKASDLPKLIEVLRHVAKEDPTLQVDINEETGEHLLHGMGELHLEIIENRIKTEKHMEVKTSPPIVVYRETVGKDSPEAEGKSPNKHNKFYFNVYPVPEPVQQALKENKMPTGRVKKKELPVFREALDAAGYDTKTSKNIRDIYEGNLFFDNTRGIVHINEIIEMVLDSFEDVMTSGPLAHEPCRNVLVSLNDVKLHEDAIHRGPSQILPAVRDGLRQAILNAKAHLLEPLQTLLFEATEEHIGEISKLISNKRGQLIDMKQEGGISQIVGKLPVAEMFGLSSELRSATNGRGTYSLIDQNFEKLPEEMQQKTISHIRERKGLGPND
jgi:elongation factor 2